MGPTPPPPKRTTSQTGRSEFRSRGPSETEAGASDEDGDRSIVKGPRLPAVNCPEKIVRGFSVEREGEMSKKEREE